MVFRPGMAWITAHQVATHLRIEPRPESGKIGGGLHGLLIGRKQMKDNWNALRTNPRRLIHTEKVLQSRGNPWGLARLVMYLHLAATFEAQSPRRIFAKAMGIDFLFEPGDKAVGRALQFRKAAPSTAEFFEGVRYLWRFEPHELQAAHQIV